ncbi:ribosome silencing factor [Tepidibacter formicigenes]|jgi:ribosome-associated protein|uniref:Ribosomal silencing factor RsfS n=1 Tax=Tepidibacter formicigenes DSM 15518 TaxID=1123349 RepID=A0A1M6JY81_9FIRM|nr:ribosome silencing factor [Tepidibacter formicigenes]SHJ51623.1 ribosome-associated protein [Tepidibacter formicigenes DSM 15518]
MINTVEEIVKKAYEAIDDKKGEDIAVLNVGNISSMADYFVITSASSERQVQAIAHNVEDELEKEGLYVKGKEGHNTSRWILLDYGDVMVHIFHSEEREFYNLERLWKDAPYVDIDNLN